MKEPAKREGRLKVNLSFDDAIKRAIGVQPPPEGWAEYERNLRKSKSRKSSKKAKT